MVPTDEVVYSELESEYDENIAEDRKDSTPNTHTKKPVRSDLEVFDLESAHSSSNGLEDTLVHTSTESDYGEDVVADRSNQTQSNPKPVL